MQIPLVSIVSYTYNRPDQLVGCCQSVWEQAYPNVEHIVVDDGSDDPAELEAICTKFGAKYIRHPENRGMVEAINTGVAAAKGDFIGQLADDDRLYNNHAHVLMMLLLSNGGKAAHGCFRIRYEEQKDGEWRVFGFNDATFAQQWQPMSAMTGGNIALPSLLVHRSFYEDHGPFDFEFCDLDLIAFVGKKEPIYTVPLYTGEILTRVGGGHWGRKNCTGEKGVENIQKLWQAHPSDDPNVRTAREGVETFLRSINDDAPFVVPPTRLVA